MEKNIESQSTLRSLRCATKINLHKQYKVNRHDVKRNPMNDLYCIFLNMPLRLVLELFLQFVTNACYLSKPSRESKYLALFYYTTSNVNIKLRSVNTRSNVSGTVLSKLG